MPLDPLYDTMLRHAVRQRNIHGEEFLIFRCPTHGFDSGDFSAAPRAGNNCEYCWWMYYMKLQNVASPTDSEAIADRLCEVVASAAQEVREGRWDYTPLAHPRLTQTEGEQDLGLNKDS